MWYFYAGLVYAFFFTCWMFGHRYVTFSEEPLDIVWLSIIIITVFSFATVCWPVFLIVGTFVWLRTRRDKGTSYYY